MAASPPPSFVIRTESDFIDPAASIPFYERQVVGHSIGFLLGAAGTGSILWSFFGNRNRLVAFVVGATSVSAGAYFLFRGYYKDPAALKKYRQQFEKESFNASLKRFGWQNLRAFVADHEIGVKLMNEIALKGFQSIWKLYGGTTLTKTVEFRILSAEFLRSRFFSDIDVMFASKSGYTTTDPLLVGESLLRALVSYGEFPRAYLSVQSAEVKRIVQADGVFRTMSFASLAQNGGIELLKLDYVDTSDVHDRFFAEVSKFRYTFGQIMEKYRNELMVMMQRDVVKGEELRSLFLAERDLRDLTDLVDLYGEFPLKEFGKLLMPEMEYMRFHSVEIEYESVKRNHEARIATTRSIQRRAESLAEETAERTTRSLDREISALKAKPTRSAIEENKLMHLQTSKRNAESDCENAINDAKVSAANQISHADVEFRQKKTSLNREWRDWLQSNLLELRREERDNTKMAQLVAAAKTPVQVTVQVQNISSAIASNTISSSSSFAPTPSAPPM